MVLHSGRDVQLAIGGSGNEMITACEVRRRLPPILPPIPAPCLPGEREAPSYRTSYRTSYLLLSYQDLPLTVLCSGVLFAFVSTALSALFAGQSTNSICPALSSVRPLWMRLLLRRIVPTLEQGLVTFLFALLQIDLYDKLRRLPPALVEDL